jgi:hypothetical protein
MSDDKSPSLEVQAGRLEAYLAEYENLWEEILSRIDSQKQVLNLQVAVVAASVSGVTIFQAEPILYLFGAFLLGLLFWVMIEQSVRMHAIGLYIRTVLSQKVDVILSNPDSPVLEWNTWTFRISPHNVSVAILSSAKFIVGSLLAVLFCVFFGVTKSVASNRWTGMEVTLFVTDVVILTIPIVQGSISSLTMLKKPTAIQESNLPSRTSTERNAPSQRHSD